MIIDQLIKAATETVHHENGTTSFFSEYDFASILIQEILDTLSEHGMLSGKYGNALRAVNDHIMGEE